MFINISCHSCFVLFGMVLEAAATSVSVFWPGSSSVTVTATVMRTSVSAGTSRRLSVIGGGIDA